MNSQLSDLFCDQLIDLFDAYCADHVGANPGLLALWEDERNRLRSRGLEGEEIDLEAPESQGK